MASMVETRLNEHQTDVIETFGSPANIRVSSGVAVAPRLAAMIGMPQARYDCILLGTVSANAGLARKVTSSASAAAT